MLRSPLARHWLSRASKVSVLRARPSVRDTIWLRRARPGRLLALIVNAFIVEAQASQGRRHASSAVEKDGMIVEKKQPNKSSEPTADPSGVVGKRRRKFPGEGRSDCPFRCRGSRRESLVAQLCTLGIV